MGHTSLALRHRARAALTAAVISGVIPAFAWAAHDNHNLIPPHAGHITWQDGDHHQHHFHATNHNANPADAVAGHDVAHQLSGNGDYDASRHWTNETHNIFDAPNGFTWNLNANTGGGTNAPNSVFSHGFIDEFPLQGLAIINIPEFSFISDMTLNNHNGAAFDSAPFIRQAFSTWSGITSDDPHLLTGLEFREAVLFEDIEIPVRVVDTLPGAIARWVPGNPGIPGFTNAKGVLEFARYDTFIGPGDAGNVLHKWYNGANLAGLGNNAAIDDMLTVALHETGHVVGLSHQIDVDDVMHVFAGNAKFLDLNAGGSFRSLSGDDVLGARDLYSIPIPEPTAALGASIMCGVTLLRRRHRPARN